MHQRHLELIIILNIFRLLNKTIFMKLIKVKAPTAWRKLNINNVIYVFDENKEALLPCDVVKQLSRIYTVIGLPIEDKEEIVPNKEEVLV